MAGTDRNPAALLKRLQKEAPRLRFFRLVRLLEQLVGGEAVGASDSPREEKLRFRHDPAMAFAAGDVRAMEFDGDKAEITTTFLGLTGAASPLPLFMAEEVLQEDDEHPLRRAFLDLFHHRFISLFYRGTVRYKPSAVHRLENDPWVARMLALAAAEDTPVLPPGRIVRLLPILMRRGRGASALRIALEIMLDGILSAPQVAIVENQGAWSEIDPNRLVHLGVKNHALGMISLGSQSRDPAGRFVVRIGPVGSEERPAFERGGLGLETIRQTVRLVLRTPLSYDIELRLRPEAVRALELGNFGRLGHDALLCGLSDAAQIVHIPSADRLSPKVKAA